MKKNGSKNRKFPMLGEASKVFKVSSVENKEFLIEIRGEEKFKNIWLVKLNQLETSLEEVNYYNKMESNDLEEKASNGQSIKDI